MEGGRDLEILAGMKGQLGVVFVTTLRIFMCLSRVVARRALEKFLQWSSVRTTHLFHCGT